MGLIDKMKFFKDENGYDKKILPVDIDNNFKLLANEIEKSGGNVSANNDEASVEFQRKISIKKTTDSNITEILHLIFPSNSAIFLKIKVIAYDKNDLLILEKNVAANFDNNGNLTIQDDETNNLAKTNENWYCYVTNGGTGPDDAPTNTISISIQGEDDKEIMWGVNAEITTLYYKG